MILSILFFSLALIALIDTGDILIFSALAGVSALWAISGNLNDIRITLKDKEKK